MSRRRRPHDLATRIVNAHMTVCEQCEKRVYETAAAARRQAKRIPGRHMSTYPCPDGNGWHLGHLPADVVQGKLDKDEYQRRVDERRAAGGAR